MFPNFSSLAQREQKRQELLERAQRRVRQASAKRDMYAGAQWSGDVSNSITTVPKTSTESTQTDEAELKKTQSYKNSQTNPELSSTESGTQTEVEPNVQMVDVAVDAEPRMNDASVFVRPQTTDRNVEARPQTKDMAVEARPQMVDSGVGSDVKQTSDASTTTHRSDTDDQVRSRNWIKKKFTDNPNWGALRIQPVRRRDDLDSSKYYLGEKGSLINVKTGNKSRSYQSIDWIATESKIRDILYDGESRSIDEISEMRLEDPLNRMKLMKPISGHKRGITDPTENDDSNRSKQRLDDAVAVDSSTSTTVDSNEGKARLKWAIFTNAVKLEQAGLKKKILPFLIIPGEKISSSTVDPDGFVWIDGSSISVFGKESGRVKPAITKEVNWRLTLQGFEELVKDRDDITLFSNGEKEKSIKGFKSVNGEARHGVKSGRDEDMDKKQTNTDNDAKKILTEYYSTLQSKHIEIPFRLKPIVDTEKGVKAHSTYYFGEPTANKPLNIRNGQNKPVVGKALTGFMKTIRWMDTFTTLLDGFEYMEKYMHENNDTSTKKNIDANLKIMNEVLRANAKSTNATTIIKSGYKYEDDQRQKHNDDPLQKLHDESEAAYQKYGEAMERYEAAKEAVKGNNVKAVRSALKAASSAMKATKSVFQIKARAYNDKKKELEGSGIKKKLTGRGLRGAGVAPLEGVVRRSRTYNLNEIQGLATPSAYVYRQLGSKYIRIPDLDAKTLVIVQPNRRKCGPKRVISDQLQAMIRTLAFKKHIDQASYDKLSIDDKKLFKEILAITHLQYNFHDRLEDPLESLRAEYDKLKGELELGNDNPSIIKQLKSLSVDMYSNRLISDSEFKDIIVRLI